MSKKQITGIGIFVVLIAIYTGVKMYASNISNIAEGKVNEAIALVVGTYVPENICSVT